ncbi:MAG TPA: hypothetical protein DHV26_12760 [Cytophagales bacterium]|nr:hypothetical protein [Cytophagales bacterium]
MLYSHSIEDNKLSLFTLFLNKLISGDIKYKDTVDRVLLDAHQLALGNKSLYQIDRDKFSIIIYLKTSHEEYFKELNPDKLTKTQYRKVLNYLQK